MTDHVHHAALAREIYQQQFDALTSREAWHRNLRLARSVSGDALRDSSYLFDISGALQKSGRHMLVFRHLMAPPTSQDQFKLLIPSWSKSTEITGKPLSKADADEIELELRRWIDPGIAAWLKVNRKPTIQEARELFERASSLIASARYATDRRSELASAQEAAVMAVLDKQGWTRVRSKTVERHASLGAREYMYKTRFATSTRPQEVDVACGLGETIVLAIECKVTNDETNSVKRINDVLKKAAAWKDHWGNFVITAAVLQGVIKASDVQRLVEHNVEVFWSHDLERFEAWLEAH